MWWLSLTTAWALPADRVVFTVGDRIVTQSDIAFETFFAAHDRSPVAAFEAPDYPVEAKLVDVAMIRALAGDIVIYRPTDDEVRARVAAFMAHFPDPLEGRRALEAWGMDEDEFLGFVFSRMVVERCVARSVVGEGDDPEWRARYAAWTGELRDRTAVRLAP